MKLPYDFRSWLWTVNGVPLVGFAAGDDAVTMERNEDSFSHEVGVTGEMSVSRSANRTGKFTFKLAANSASNTYLGSLMALQEGGATSFVAVRVGCQDQALQDVCTGTIGFLLKPAGMTRGAKPGDMEWSIVVERMDFVYGGASIFDL